jgi:glycogen debranching enzyme
MPWLSAEILEYFTHYQGKKFEAETEEEPGKMPHEIRVGEMARCAEIAFRPYYGTVDATQLWLMLMGEYVKQTGDLDLPTRLWKHIVAAERFLARNTKDGANFIFYGGKPGQALTNTCWKDSGNSMVYADGTCPDKDVSIAVCEAQGYLYQAWTATADLARLIGRKRFEQRMRVKAARLKARFEKEFWMAGKEFVAMAVDSNGRQLDVISSNPGHLLSTGILSREAELKVADRLMHADMFSGWGIRTLAASEKAFNPDDYQVGSIWPHDNGFAASAMSVVGRPSHAKDVFKGMFDTASHHSDLRLPELFGGQDRVLGEPPVPYQVACVPQAWAAGCWFHMLAGMMNIVPDAPAKRVDIIHPDLPEWLGTVRVTGLRIADAELDLEFAPREGGKSTCRVTRLVGELEVRITCD